MEPENELADTTPSSRRTTTARIGATVLAGGVVLAGGSLLLGGTGPASAAPAPERSVARVTTAPGVDPAISAALQAKKEAVAAAAAAPATTDPDDAPLAAYFAAGYDYDDAVALAKLWGSNDPFQTKVDAGKRLEAGQTLPIKPGSAAAAPEVTTAEDADVNEFFAKGYTYDDAVQLAKAWGTATPYDAKVAGGRKLLAGETLPVAP